MKNIKLVINNDSKKEKTFHFLSEHNHLDVNSWIQAHEAYCEEQKESENNKPRQCYISALTWAKIQTRGELIRDNKREEANKLSKQIQKIKTRTAK